MENTPFIINRYRESALAEGYFGDSVINSVFDIFAMIAGFWLARRIPVAASVAILVGFELLTAYVIRDGLALNVLMLIYPLDAVRMWQGGL